MIDNTFIQSPEYQDYLDNKDQISEESVVFVEDKERLITLRKEYQFVPSSGEEGQVLHKTEDGVEWGDILASEGGLTKEEADGLYKPLIEKVLITNVTYDVSTNTAKITGDNGDYGAPKNVVSLIVDTNGTAAFKRYYNITLLQSYQYHTMSDEDDSYYIGYFTLDNILYEIKLTRGYSDRDFSSVTVSKIQNTILDDSIIYIPLIKLDFDTPTYCAPEANDIIGNAMKSHKKIIFTYTDTATGDAKNYEVTSYWMGLKYSTDFYFLNIATENGIITCEHLVGDTDFYMYIRDVPNPYGNAERILGYSVNVVNKGVHSNLELNGLLKKDTIYFVTEN